MLKLLKLHLMPVLAWINSKISAVKGVRTQEHPYHVVTKSPLLFILMALSLLFSAIALFLVSFVFDEAIYCDVISNILGNSCNNLNMVSPVDDGSMLAIDNSAPNAANMPKDVDSSTASAKLKKLWHDRPVYFVFHFVVLPCVAAFCFYNAIYY